MLVLGKCSVQSAKFLFAGEGTDLHKPVVLAQLTEEITLLPQCSAPSQQFIYQERVHGASYIQPKERVS